MPDYRCGTCGTGAIILTAVDCRWRVTCENGHEWLPTPGTHVTVTLHREGDDNA